MPKLLRELRGLVGRPALWIWMAATLVSLFLPLTRVVGYEFALVQGALLVLLAPWLEPASARAASGPWVKWGSHLVFLTLGLALMTALGAVNAIRVRNCDLGAGAAFVGILALGAAPLAAAWHLLSQRLAPAQRPRWVGVVIYYAGLALSVGASALWLATQPPLVVYDAFFGFFSSSLYDEALDGALAHAAFRAMTWAAATLWVALLAWEHRPSRRDAAIALVAGLALLGLGLNKGALNIARDRAWTQEFLGGFVRTEHFEIYYDARAMRAADVVQLVADHEARYAELRAFWGIEPPLPLRSYIYASRERRGQAMGSRNTMIARIWLREMHLVWNAPTEGLLAHELSHLFLHDAGQGPLRIAAFQGVVPLMGLVEGSAGAAAWEADDLTEHGWAAAIMRLGLIGDPAQTLGASGFWSQNSGVVYTLWASFSRWLIDTHGGPQPYLRAYAGGDFEGAYGRPLSELLSTWQQMLREVTLDEAQLGEAALRFGRASILQRECGRALAAMEAEAVDAVSRRDLREARRCLQTLESHTRRDPPLRYRLSLLWEHLDRDEEAQRLLRDVVDDDASGDALRQNARLRLADLRWRALDYAGALRWLSSLDEAPQSASIARNRWVREAVIQERMERPNSEEAVRKYLASGWRYREVDLRVDLIVAALEETSAPVLWLSLNASSRSPSAEAPAELYELLAQARVPAGVAVRAELAYGRWLILRGDRRGCELLRGVAEAAINDADGLAASAKTLYHRCDDAGLYLDAARRAVE